MKKFIKIVGGELIPLERVRGIEFVKQVDGVRTSYTIYLEICKGDQFWKELNLPFRFSNYEDVMKFGKRESYVKLKVEIIENATNQTDKEMFMKFKEIARGLIEKQKAYIESLGEIIAL